MKVVEIEGQVWARDDLMVDARGDIFRLCYFAPDLWYWSTFGDEDLWGVHPNTTDRGRVDAPVKPWRKAALYILDPGQVAKPVGPAE